MRACDECPDLPRCERRARCLRRDPPQWEDLEGIREYGEGVREVLRRQDAPSEKDFGSHDDG